ncbi:MAG: 6-phosphogluconolactonase [Planctomycetales bacterium]|nr:6-phosphogluconolactonase [Planctomycetales bacterium]
MRDQVHVCNDPESLAQYASTWLQRLITQHHLSSSAPFIISLAGGTTPKRLYELLASLPPGEIDWQRIILLWGDERCVATDDKQSNFRMVKESLLDHVDIPAENVLSVPHPEQSPQSVADAYEEFLRERLHQSKPRGFPRVHCALLGLGNDVHTASLFPGTSAIAEKTRIVVANHVPQLDSWRITLTAPMLNAARNVAFLISGQSKRNAIASMWHAAKDTQRFPAQLIRPRNGQLWYLMDKAAIGNTPLPETVMVQLI